MEITFDPAKDRSNRRKHGVSLPLAQWIDWPEVMAKPDTRQDYGEVREIGYAIIDDRLYCAVFTQRADKIHIVSLRKANSREVRNHVEQT
ncbi:BrnT family toxin [Castellaniella sp.]|uniref:BrnT family toxin n=1 Tax=Castellaniella sp. TaxID=1955812 RepID=UPI003569ED72